MTGEEIRDIVLRNLGAIAPEADLDQVRPDVGLREQLDIDSVDFLNFMIALHRELKVDIPEKDYPKLATLNSIVEYLIRAMGKRQEE